MLFNSDSNLEQNYVSEIKIRLKDWAKLLKITNAGSEKNWVQEK